MSTVETLFTSLWGNGATIQVVYYPEGLDGEALSDRLQLVVTPAGGQPRGWLMNVTDATDIIYGLSKGINRALEDGIPPREGEPYTDN